jgi:hypothetical protein
MSGCQEPICGLKIGIKLKRCMKLSNSLVVLTLKIELCSHNQVDDAVTVDRVGVPHSALALLQPCAPSRPGIVHTIGEWKLNSGLAPRPVGIPPPLHASPSHMRSVYKPARHAHLPKMRPNTAPGMLRSWLAEKHPWAEPYSVFVDCPADAAAFGFDSSKVPGPATVGPRHFFRQPRPGFRNLPTTVTPLGIVRGPTPSNIVGETKQEPAAIRKCG